MRTNGARPARARPEGPIRVMVVTSALWPGGAERHLATVLPALDPRRVEAAVCCVQQEGDYFTALQAAGIRCVAIRCPLRRQAPVALSRVAREVGRFRPDVVLTFPVNADLIGRLAGTLRRVPVVAGWKHSCGHTRAHALDRLAERLLAPLTDYCVGVSPAQTRFLVAELGVAPRKLLFAPNGIDLSRFPGRDEAVRDDALARSLGLPPGLPVIGVLARFRPEKDHRTFLRAARLVADRRPDARFLLVGDGPLQDELRALARALGLDGRVVFAGKRDDVMPLLTLLDLSVLPSANDCFPYAVLESMAMGLPVVATSVGALPDIVEEGVTGHLVPPRDPERLAERMLELLDGPERARALGAAGRRRVERNFGLAGAAAALEGLIAEMAHGRARW